jgi:hypothetical protein
MDGIASALATRSTARTIPSRPSIFRVNGLGRCLVTRMPNARGGPRSPAPGLGRLAAWRLTGPVGVSQNERQHTECRETVHYCDDRERLLEVPSKPRQSRSRPPTGGSGDISNEHAGSRQQKDENGAALASASRGLWCWSADNLHMSSPANAPRFLAVPLGLDPAVAKAEHVGGIIMIALLARFFVKPELVEAARQR